MGATEIAGFNAIVQRNLGLDFVTGQHKSEIVGQLLVFLSDLAVLLF